MPYIFCDCGARGMQADIDDDFLEEMPKEIFTGDFADQYVLELRIASVHVLPKLVDMEGASDVTKEVWKDFELWELTHQAWYDGPDSPESSEESEDPYFNVVLAPAANCFHRSAGGEELYAAASLWLQHMTDLLAAGVFEPFWPYEIRQRK